MVQNLEFYDERDQYITRTDIIVDTEEELDEPNER